MNAISLTWQPEGAFHHVGFVVASIPNSVRGFASMLQAEWDEQFFHDPNQGVRVAFLKSRRAGDPLWELVEPADEQSPVYSFAAKGGGRHHVCYVVDNLAQALKPAGRSRQADRRWRIRSGRAAAGRTLAARSRVGNSELRNFTTRRVA